ncbi:AMP-binding enzyme-domain-containing protein [Coniella lustricola]|uniref:AMP-binding enzyme-domain-containing protein n=1 Tax=Coniella lustricola TaxID=2025994 RepID=A0A2T3A387_9PEZI|nr:AMP-binding enzyme-domain-containing protein [Coniella lustricola]
MVSTCSSPAPLPRLPVFEAIASHDPASTAVVHSVSQRTFTYGELLGDVSRARDQLLQKAEREDIEGERVAFLVENGYDYVVTWLAILAAKAIAVPLAPSFPAPELQYILGQSEAILLLSSERFASKAQETLALPLVTPPRHVVLPKHLGRRGGGSKTTPANPDRLAERQVALSESTDPGSAGLMLYTSGTTNRPKGVLIPLSAMTAQARSLLQAWEYSPQDRLLHVLPLHHIHGTINGILAPLFAGSSVEFLFPFNADAVWKRFAAPFLEEENEQEEAKTNGHGTTNGHSVTNGHTTTNGSPTNGTTNGTTNGHTRPSLPKEKITFFTVVPTVYSRLLATHRQLSPALQSATRTAISPAHLRLCISGSAALPTPIKRAWADLSHGNILLERFGMTEVGMALSCGLAFPDRVDGSVGWPLPGVQARLVDVDTGEVIAPGQERDKDGRERAGEIQLRGPTVFKEYWRNPTATAAEFVDPDPVEDARQDQHQHNGQQSPHPNGGKWFKTGDVAVRRPVPTAGLTSTTRASQNWTGAGDMYFILGRKSADIIKSGGEKVSALEVERELLSLPEIAEAAVVAVPSGKWGQKVGAVVILNKENFPPPSPAEQVMVVDGEETVKNGGVKWTALDMRRALKGRLVAYKIPQVLRVVDHIPRNAMGKINKKNLVKAIFQDDFSGDEM